MTRTQRDQRFLSWYASRPVSMPLLLAMVAIALLAIGLATAASFVGQSGSAIPAFLLCLTAVLFALRYLMIDPLIREVRRLREELDAVRGEPHAESQQA